MRRVAAALGAARSDGRTVAVRVLTDPSAPDGAFRAPGEWTERLPGLSPRPWAPDAAAHTAVAKAFEGQRHDTLWISDGLDRPGRAELLAALRKNGSVTAYVGRTAVGLGPPSQDGGRIAVPVLSAGSLPEGLRVRAVGPDPAGIERPLAEAAPEDGVARFDLPVELRNRIRRFEVSGLRSAGAVALTDDRLRRKKIALVAGRSRQEELELLSPLHYLREALAPTAKLLDGALLDSLRANPDAVILADVAELAAAESEALKAWVEEGGTLVRFAGPRLAGARLDEREEDPLLPVRLRRGGRAVGGAMSWGEPKRISPFPDGSPFAGLTVPEDVTVRIQVLAEPAPDLAAHTIATLRDGTPLVTRKALGAGQVVLFHVSADAEWSDLPLSVLFVKMLERLSIAGRVDPPGAADLVGTVWVPDRLLDAFGRLEEATDRAAIRGERLAGARPGPELPPGLYAGDERLLALNVLGEDDRLTPFTWPSDVEVSGLAFVPERDLKGPVLFLALVALLLDIAATMWLAAGGRGIGRRLVPAILAAALVGALPPVSARAQGVGQGAPADAPAVDEATAIAATRNVVLAYVRTGDPAVDRVSEAGLAGLSSVLRQRTSVEPSPPIGVDVETDELAFFPMIYWPVTERQTRPSPQAYERLNRFLRAGGMIVFDTRDADLGSLASTPNGRRLRVLAAPLDIPPLEPVPSDHVLTRAFYLLQEFPGRYASDEVWVEAAPPDAERVEGVPFRNLNDGVTPVIIGGNDWAAAWALDDAGRPMFRVGRGLAGERQREFAFRFGVNLVMHVLTGNYKSDQVHVPALLERLGQ